MKEDKKMPSMGQMIKTFSKDLATYIINGAKNVTEEDYKGRLDTCAACPSLNADAMRCTTCGCMVEHKAKWRNTSCPEDKWKAQDD